MAELREMASSSSVVSLNNWDRLSNALFELPELSSVYWRDYIVVMDVVKGDCQLYSVKWNMWSRLEPKFPDQPARGSPLVCFNNKLLALGSNGILYEFLPEMSRWKKNEALNVQLGLGRSTEAASGYYYQQLIQTTLLEARFVSNESTLFCIYVAHENRQRQQSWASDFVNVSSTRRASMKMYDGSSWSHPTELWSEISTSSQLQKQILSVTVAQHSQSQTIYVNTDQDMYSVRVPPPESVGSSQSSESTTTATAAAAKGSSTTEAKLEMTVATHAAPPHNMSTLSVIDGYLFAFGGKDQDNQPFATIYCYTPETNSWSGAGSMLSSRYGVAVTAVKRDRDSGSDVYAIGGYLGESTEVKISCRIIECCNVSVNRGD